MRRRYPLERVQVLNESLPGTTTTATGYRYQKIRTYYRITRSTNTWVSGGVSDVRHSWWCEEDSTFLNVTIGPFRSWRAAMDYAQFMMRTRS